MPATSGLPNKVTQKSRLLLFTAVACSMSLLMAPQPSTCSGSLDMALKQRHSQTSSQAPLKNISASIEGCVNGNVVSSHRRCTSPNNFTTRLSRVVLREIVTHSALYVTLLAYCRSSMTHWRLASSLPPAANTQMQGHASRVEPRPGMLLFSHVRTPSI